MRRSRAEGGTVLAPARWKSDHQEHPWVPIWAGASSAYRFSWTPIRLVRVGAVGDIEGDGVSAEHRRLLAARRVVVAAGGERSPHRRRGTDSWVVGPESQERPCMVGGSSAGGTSVVGRPEELISRRSWLVIDPATAETLLKKDLHCLDSGNTVEVAHTQDP